MRRAAFLVTAAAGLAALFASPAEAHFILQEPACWESQDGEGIPEKAPPCGNESGGTPTNQVTVFQAGSSITITVDEVVCHPGHYRVAVAQDQASLPPEPAVDAGALPDSGNASAPCGVAEIEATPQFPVLADDLFDHYACFTSPQTATVQLPQGFTCDNCVLQIIEFMSDHGLNVPGGCFYHHCANITVTDNSVPDGGLVVEAGTYDAGTTGGFDAGTGGAGGGTGGTGGAGGAGGTGGNGAQPPNSSSGCSCRATDVGGASGGLAILAVASSLLARRRGRARKG